MPRQAPILSYAPDASPGRIAITHSDEPALLAALAGRMARREGFTLATLNLDHLVKLRADETFREAYAAHSHVVADGNPIVWLHRLAGRRIGLIPGSELVGPLCDAAAVADTPLALLGSTADVLDGVAERLERDHPGLRVAARIAPPMGFDPTGTGAQDAIGRLREAAPSGLCLLALGAPKQERFAAYAARHLAGWGFASIGAGLDFVVGHQTRAPAWVQRIAMEWAWRMAGNPRRLAARYAACFAILPGLAREAQAARRD